MGNRGSVVKEGIGGRGAWCGEGDGGVGVWGRGGLLGLGGEVAGVNKRKRGERREGKKRLIIGIVVFERTSKRRPSTVTK